MRTVLRMPRPAGALAQLVMILAIVNLFFAGWTMTLRAAGVSGAVRIVAFGDSLTAGYMLAPAEAFPAQLEKALEGKGHDVEIANAGVSGDTSAGGRQRLDWSVPEGTEAVILELGSNDALRGIDPSLVKESLDDIVKRLKARGIEILIAGMSSPENWGKDYADRFNVIYRDLAERYDLILYPFFLDGVALKPELNLPDGLHPTGKGVAIIVERMLPDAETLVGRVLARRSGAVSGR